MFFPGFPFGFGQPPSNQADEQQEQQETLYTVLELSEDATPEQITEKHKQLTDKFTTGQQADPDRLQQINEAFQILSDPQQRKIYHKQIAQQKQMFEMMYGKQKGQKVAKELPKMQPMKRALEVPLQKIYTGDKMPLFHQRARICDVCQGKGGPDASQCPDCKGQGAITKLAQVGPGMYTQMEQNCTHCQGMGDIFGQGGKCPTCQGRRIVKKGTDLSIPIPPGAPAGHVITIEGEGNHLHTTRPGDLILIVQQLPNEIFTRKGADLFMKKTITLIETLLGFHFSFQHLDGQQYTLYTRPGQIIGDGHKKIVRNLGMPFFDQPQSKGHLIIEFKVTMPKRGELTAQQLKILSTILPGKINERPKDTNYQMLEDFERDNVNSNEEGGKKQEDEGQQQGGIGCHPQ